MTAKGVKVTGVHHRSDMLLNKRFHFVRKSEPAAFVGVIGLGPEHLEIRPQQRENLVPADVRPVGRFMLQPPPDGQHLAVVAPQLRVRHRAQPPGLFFRLFVHQIFAQLLLLLV